MRPGQPRSWSCAALPCDPGFGCIVDISRGEQQLGPHSAVLLASDR
jgi:hypothetical protein